MKILVTGGAGMIGANLTRRLAEMGHDVNVVDNLWRGTKRNLAIFLGDAFIKNNFILADLTEPEECRKVTKGYDVVFHLADVVAGIGYVFGNQHFIFHQNSAINTNTLAAAIENNVGHFIYVGTACSYPQHLTTGKARASKLVEEDVLPANPESAYGWSKLMGEYELQVAGNEGLIQASILRLHNVYGFPSEFVGDRSQVIPSLARKIARYPEEDFVVWGSGKQRRSFVYVDDVVEALVLSLTKGINAGPIQIGPSSSTSIKQIASALIGISGKTIPLRFDLAKPEGDGDRVGDFSKAELLLGWAPKINMEDGLSRTYEWIAKEIHSLVEDIP